MTTCWVDTETTGLTPEDSGAFEIALLVFRDSEFLGERVFYLNPLNETIKFGDEAFKVHGVSEETIRAYPPAEKVMSEIVEYIQEFVPEDRLVFAGYCCAFDYRHIKALFERYGLTMETWFNGRMIDVHELVKRASYKGILPKTNDKKLETMCKALGIQLGQAHTALADIWAARRLYETIFKMERKEQ